MAEDGKPNKFFYDGFEGPRFTQTPDDLFDVLMARLSEAELKVLLYIIRRTFGFGKRADAISLNQMIDGIKTRDGQVLDTGTGLSRSSVRRGVMGLEEKGIIAVNKVVSEDGDYESNVYSLRFRAEQGVVSNSNHPAEGVVSNSNHRGSKLRPGVVSNSNPQETVEQETVEQETGRILDISRGTTRNRIYSEAREELQQFVSDFAREFGDEAPLSSSLTRMVNLFVRSQLSIDDFVGLMYDARALTKEHQASVTKESASGRRGAKNRMPYFFKIIEDLIERDQRQEQ